MITCLSWVKRGVAKSVPDKVTISKDELQDLIDDAREKLREQEEAEKSKEAAVASEAKSDKTIKKPKQPKQGGDEEDVTDLYDLEHYDSDEDTEGVNMTGAGMAGLTYFASNKDDPYITLENPVDEEEEDFIIKPEDNLLVVGHVDEEFSTLEVYVYNEEEENHYVHHDILLEAFPLALEWLSYDPAGASAGNYLAVGSMAPHIDIWDLDIVDTMEPVVTLGGRRKKKSKKKSKSSGEGHKDAVLDLSWNHVARNVLGSASADHSVVLWDLQQTKAVHVLNHHKDKVQSLQWHPYEAQSLLTGSFDKRAKVLDCRNPEANIKSWKFDGEVERCIWNPFSPFNFLVSTESGHVYCCDVRAESPVFTLKAHDDAVTGLSLSSQVPGCLSTVSADKTLKVWDIQDNKPSFILSREMNVGRVLCASCCPDSPLMFAVGGEIAGLQMFNAANSAPVRRHFETRPRLAPVLDGVSAGKSRDGASEVATDDAGGSEPMEEESAASAMAALHLSSGTSSGTKKKKKKRK